MCSFTCICLLRNQTCLLPRQNNNRTHIEVWHSCRGLNIADQNSLKFLKTYLFISTKHSDIKGKNKKDRKQRKFKLLQRKNWRFFMFAVLCTVVISSRILCRTQLLSMLSFAVIHFIIHKIFQVMLI